MNVPTKAMVMMIDDKKGHDVDGIDTPYYIQAEAYYNFWFILVQCIENSKQRLLPQVETPEPFTSFTCFCFSGSSICLTYVFCFTCYSCLSHFSSNSLHPSIFPTTSQAFVGLGLSDAGDFSNDVRKNKMPHYVLEKQHLINL